MSVEPQIISPEPTGDELLVLYLRSHHATCPACNYDLHQLTQPRCPECGRALSLNVNVVEPYLRIWLAATIILFMNAGLGALITIAFVKEILMEGRLGSMPLRIWAVMTVYFVAIPVAFAFLWFRSRFVKLGRSAQVASLGIVCFVTIAAVFLMFVVAN